jgi:putative endonuclease
MSSLSNDSDRSYSHGKVELGIKGEKIAADFLENAGYIILKRNEQVGHSDIDILARDGKTLVFVEVRTKSKSDRGMPEETLTKKKLDRMRKTAELHMALHRYDGLARLDAVCLILDSNDRMTHMEHYIGVG